MATMGTDNRGALILPALESPRSQYAAYSYGPLVANWTKRRLRMDLSAWQSHALGRILEADSDGNLIARQALISVARQNGKSVIVRSLMGWVLDEGYKIAAFQGWNLLILAAHDAKQARIPYDFIRRDLEGYYNFEGISRKAGRRKARSTYYTGIEMNGVKIDVATRQAGSQRGISPGLIAFDEVLTQTDFSMYEVLSPAQSAIPNSLMLMTSTAGFADSVVLRSFHDRLYRQATEAEQHDPTFVGLWWRASHDDVTPDDVEEMQNANPSYYDGRLSHRAFAAEYEIMPRGSWVRERLNRWHDERVDAPFSLAAWGNCRLRQPLDPSKIDDLGQYTIAVDVTSIWSEGSIIIAAQRSDDRVGVEVHRYLRARPERPLRAEDFTSEVLKLARKLRVEQIVYSASSPLAPAMERIAVIESLPCISVNNIRMQLACHDFAESILAKRIAHDDPHLDSQIASAQRRYIGKEGGWRWVISVTPITSVVGATLATMYAAKALSPVQVFL